MKELRNQALEGLVEGLRKEIGTCFLLYLREEIEFDALEHHLDDIFECFEIVSAAITERVDENGALATTQSIPSARDSGKKTK
jgi:hypothetical protein